MDMRSFLRGAFFREIVKMPEEWLTCFAEMC